MPKVQGNVGGAPAHSADRDKQFEIYDRLPVSLRQIVDAAPVPMDLVEVEAVLARYGQEAERVIVSHLMIEFPGWRMPEAKS